MPVIPTLDISESNPPHNSENSYFELIRLLAKQAVPGNCVRTERLDIEIWSGLCETDLKPIRRPNLLPLLLRALALLSFLPPASSTVLPS
jgi:hypothetical protein